MKDLTTKVLVAAALRIATDYNKELTSIQFEDGSSKKFNCIFQGETGNTFVTLEKDYADLRQHRALVLQNKQTDIAHELSMLVASVVEVAKTVIEKRPEDNIWTLPIEPGELLDKLGDLRLKFDPDFRNAFTMRCNIYIKIDDQHLMVHL